MAKQKVTIDGVGYASRTAAAVALVAGGMGLKEAAAKVGLTYQTVYANTTGLEKVKIRRAHYRILSLGRKGRRTAGEIAKKVGMTTSRVVALLRKNSIPVVTLESRDKTKATKKNRKATPQATDTTPTAAATEPTAAEPVAPEATVVSSTTEVQTSA